MWAIWKARNGKIFDKNNPSIQRIILETHFWYNYNLPNSEDVSITPNSTTATSRSRIINLERWVPPANWIKLNTAAFISNSGACAMVARNADAKFEAGGTCGHNCNPPMEAEAKAITLAFDLAEKMEWKDIIIESDAEKVIKVLNNEIASYPWRLRPMILQIKDRSMFKIHQERCK